MDAHTQIIGTLSFHRDVDGQKHTFGYKEKLVLLTIHHCNSQNLPTSYRNLSKLALMCVGSVVRSLNCLLALGMIRKRNHVDTETNGIAANSYEIDFVVVKSAQRATLKVVSSLEG